MNDDCEHYKIEIECEDTAYEIEVSESNDYNKLLGKPSINNITLFGNKTSDELNIMGKYMDTVELSTNIENPTEILDFINKSGTYVAKNAGILSYQGNPITILAKGYFFTVLNYKDIATIIGEEISDEDNLILITIPTIEGYNLLLYKKGNNNWENAVDINSLNINDYVKIDTSNLITRNQINSAYGIQLKDNQLAITPATESEIELGQAIYKPITAQKIDYAVNNKGKKYFSTKEELQKVQDNINNIITEIESVLDTVVNVNE